MNHRTLCLFVLFGFAVFGMAGCVSAQQTSNLEGVVLPSAVKLAQGNVLDHVTSASHLSSVPAIIDWQLDMDTSSNGEYRFYSGNWRMIICPAAKTGVQQVIIMDTVQDVSWCGFIGVDGDIVDTCLRR